MGKKRGKGQEKMEGEGEKLEYGHPRFRTYILIYINKTILLLVKRRL